MAAPGSRIARTDCRVIRGEAGLFDHPRLHEKAPTLADIEGFGAAEEVARQMVSDLVDWRDGHLAWSEVQRSVLFHGAPGTGKSFLASAMGNSAGVTMVRGSFAEWQAVVIWETC